MTQQVATIVYIVFICGLFYLDRDTGAKTSKALWIPVMWLLIVGSRPVSMWLVTSPVISEGEVGAEGSPIDAAVFAILIVAAVVVISSRWATIRGVLRGNSALILYFAYCGLSIAWSDHSVVSLKRWVKAVADFMMILIVLTDPDPEIATKRFFSRVGFVLLPVSVLFIKYYPNLGRSYNQWTWEPSYCGVTTFKNELGMICLVCTLGALWSFVGAYESRGMPHRLQHMIANGTVVAMAVWLFLTADSMTSFSCFLMAGAIILMTTRRWVARNIRAVHILVAGCVVLSIFALFGNHSGGLVHSLGRDPTLTGRTEIWQAVLSVHTNPVLGAGFENFWVGERMERVWEITAQHIQEAHDGYLEVYLNLGWIGVVLLAAVIVTGYRNAVAIYRRNLHAGRIRVALFTAGVIYSVTEAGFRMMSPIWIGFLLAVTFVPPNLLHSKRPKTARRSVTRIAPTAEKSVVIAEFV
jgi:exopolysaccharide production protein ExoQ